MSLASECVSHQKRYTRLGTQVLLTLLALVRKYLGHSVQLDTQYPLCRGLYQALRSCWGSVQKVGLTELELFDRGHIWYERTLLVKAVFSFTSETAKLTSLAETSS